MKNLFVLNGIVEVQGQFHAQPNKDLVLEHKVVPVVNWKKKTASQKILDAKKKKIKLTGNLDFPSPFSPEFVTLLKFGIDIDNADAKLMARLQKMPGSKNGLAAFVNLVYDDVQNLCMMLFLKMRTVAPDEAVRICNDAGFEYKSVFIRTKRPNKVLKAVEPGVLVVWAQGKGQRQWQESPDTNQGTIIDLPPTSGGITTVRNLISKKEYWFRWRLVLTKGRYGAWSDWYSGTAL